MEGWWEEKRPRSYVEWNRWDVCRIGSVHGWDSEKYLTGEQRLFIQLKYTPSTTPQGGWKVCYSGKESTTSAEQKGKKDGERGETVKVAEEQTSECNKQNSTISWTNENICPSKGGRGGLEVGPSASLSMSAMSLRRGVGVEWSLRIIKHAPMDHTWCHFATTCVKCIKPQPTKSLEWLNKF